MTRKPYSHHGPSSTARAQDLQGNSPASGPLFGGGLEVLEFLKATPFWPEPGFRDARVLFLETSEEKLPPRRV